MSRKKILLWHWGRRGGGPRYTLELARALKEQKRFDLHLSLSRQSELFDQSQALELPSFHVDTYVGYASALASSFKLPWIRKHFWSYVKSRNIDIIIGTMSHLWNVPILAHSKQITPYLMVLHDALPHPGDDLPMRQWLLKKEIGYADGVVTLTQHVQSILCDVYKYPRARSWVIPHGIFAYDKPVIQRSGDSVRLLFFGRILPYKGLDILLAAYAILRAQKIPVTLHICGAGDLTPYADALGYLEDVTIDHRWIGEADIGRIFAQADLCVLPYREASQSGVIATAYAAGVPVIVTPVGGLTEQVFHEKTGLVAAATNAAALAHSIQRLVEDTALRQHCAQGALAIANDQFSWSSIAVQFAQAIDSMSRGD